MVSATEAKEDERRPDFRVNYSYNNAVNFFERGIEFYVFTNGNFDFDTNSRNRRTRIDRDYSGKIRRIENVTISYDYRGNVTRIGNISLRYYRDRLTNVGDLRVRYDSWGNPLFYGNVRDYYYNNGIRFNISFGDVCNYNDSYFYGNDFRTNYSKFREDKNYYYYRAKTNAKIGKRSTILKRRKPVNSVRNSTSTRDRRNNSYRKPTDVNRRNSSNRNMTSSNRTHNRSTINKRNSISSDKKNDTKRRSSSDRKIDTKKKVKSTRSKATSKNTKTDRKRRG